MGVVTFVVTWWDVVKQKTANSLRISGLGWCHQESNRGHKDFQSFALPTELWHQNVGANQRGMPQNCDAKLAVIFESAKFSSIILCHNFIQKLFLRYGTNVYA